MKLCVFEDSSWDHFLPLTYTRAYFDLKCGILKLRHKISRFYPDDEKYLILREELKQLYISRYPEYKINHFEKGEYLFINGRLLFDEMMKQELDSLELETGLFNDDACIAARVLIGHEGDISTEHLPKIFSKLKKIDTKIQPIQYIWELVAKNEEQIALDYKFLIKNKISQHLQDGTFHMMNFSEIFFGEDVIIEPGVVLDATNGPIMIDDDAQIMANAVIKGPVYVGKGSTVKVGAKIYEGTSIGKVCKVGGEVEGTIFQAFSNKQHEGFLGHSYIGEWVNIGADANNSDLKNNYNHVKTFYYPLRNFKDTGSQFFGAVFADHVKTGINTTFNTGIVIGVGCNLYSSLLFSGFIPSFSIGSANRMGEYHLKKMLQTAEIVKSRRGLELTDDEKTILESCYKRSASLRKIF